MKYRLDSVRRNKTRLKRRFLMTPPVKKQRPPRKKKWSFLPVFVVLSYLLIGVSYFWQQKVSEQKIYQLKEEIAFAHAANLVMKEEPQPQKVVVKEVEKKVYVTRRGKRNKDCVYSRVGASYSTVCK